MTKPTISDLQDSLNRVDLRVSTQEANYSTIEKRLAVQNDQNELLQKQLTARWGYITGMLPVLMLAFLLNFGYELWKIKEIQDIKTDLEANSKLLSDNAAKYAEILHRIATADTNILDANLKLYRKDLGGTIESADQAASQLNEALNQTGFSGSPFDVSFDEKTCALTSLSPLSRLKLEENRLSDRIEYESNKKRATALNNVLSPTRLRSTVLLSLYSAYDLRATALFGKSDFGQLRKAGASLLALDAERSEGYHWFAVAASGVRNSDLAEQCYKGSVNRGRPVNKDNINLAELYFVRGKYKESFDYSSAYLKSVNSQFDSAIDVICAFYHALAAYLVDPRTTTAPDKFLDRMREKRIISLEGIFDSSTLMNYLNDSTGPFSKLPPTEQTVVVKVKECLLLGKCDAISKTKL